MRARACVAVEADDRGGARLTRLRSQAPLVARWTRAGLVLVAGAGGPLGGDDLHLDVDVGPGASLRVSSAAATVVQPARGDGAARVVVDVRVGPAGLLRWEPEPVVVARGAGLVTSAALRCAGSARIHWRETVVLGRLDERPGDVRTRLDVQVAGRPLLRQELVAGPGAPAGWDSAAATGGYRVMGTLLVVEPGLTEHARSPVEIRPAVPPGGPTACAVLRLEGPGILITALGATTLAVRDALDAAAAGLVRRPGAGARP